MKIWIILFTVVNAYAFPTLERSPTVKPSTQDGNQSVYIEEIHENDNQSVEGDFPNFITTGQWKEGSAVIAFLIGVYCFTFLAIICDNYFLPCIERICETLSLSQDIAAATFMAMATSAPEFFVNVIGTFITKSDIGVGTVIGSSMFNTLGVAALGSLAATKPIQVDWWPVTRDCTIYIISIFILVLMTWDGCIFWYEGMILFSVYFVYFCIMFNNKKLSEAARYLIAMYSKRHENETNTADEKGEKVAEESPPVYTVEESIQYYSEYKENGDTKHQVKEDVSDVVYKRTCQDYILSLWSVIVFPLKLILWCTVPNPRTWPKLFPITFITCIILIGTNSYIVSWMISVIGHALQVPDVVLGLTFLAAGGCLPEAVSIVIMSRKGDGSMGVSNALGANSMNILLSLGLPWFVKTILLNVDEEQYKFIQLESETIVYTIMGLILVVVTLFTVLYINKFRLDRRTGIALLAAYLVFLSLAITSELFLNKPVTS